MVYSLTMISTNYFSKKWSDNRLLSLARPGEREILQSRTRDCYMKATALRLHAHLSMRKTLQFVNYLVDKRTVDAPVDSLQKHRSNISRE